MADAPKRIWLQLGAGDEGTHTWADHQVGWDDDGEYEPEYIRADVAEAEKQLAVAAAQDAELERCAQVVESLWAFRTCAEVAAVIRAMPEIEAVKVWPTARATTARST